MARVAVFGICSFVISVVLTQLCKHAGRRVGVVALPRADRWHPAPVPLLGGLAIALALAAVLPFAVRITPALVVLLSGAAAMFVLGLADDLHTLTPTAKLIAQIIVAALLAAFGLQFRLTTVPMLNFAVTVFWIVGITNAFNLLDNMDGLAAGIAVITAGFRLAFFVADGDLEAAALASVFLGAVLGFLAHNFSPSSIFMGDAGSLLVGLFISGLSLIGDHPHSRGVLSVLLAPVLIALVPIFDTSFVTVSRMLAQRPVSVGGRDHTSHRLVALGLSERRAVLSLYVLAFASGLVAYFTRQLGFSYGVVLIAFLVLGTTLLGVFLSPARTTPPDEDARAADRTVLGLLFALLSTRRQVITVLVDLALIMLAYYSAYLLRFEDDVRVYENVIITSLPIVIICQIGSFGIFRVHYAIWRYIGLKDLLRIAQAASAGTVAAVIVLVYAYRFVGYSRAVFVLDWVLLIVFVAAARLSFRVLAEYLRSESGSSSRVLLYGAGEGGMVMLRELHVNPALGRSPVGFVDDDPIKQHRLLQGVPVLGGADELPEILRTHHIEEVVIASKKIPEDRVRRVTQICKKHGVRTVRAALHLE